VHPLVDHRGAEADDLAALAEPVEQERVQMVQIGQRLVG
jgi:hypothetical protein